MTDRRRVSRALVTSSLALVTIMTPSLQKPDFFALYSDEAFHAQVEVEEFVSYVLASSLNEVSSSTGWKHNPGGYRRLESITDSNSPIQSELYGYFKELLDLQRVLIACISEHWPIRRSRSRHLLCTVQPQTTVVVPQNRPVRNSRLAGRSCAVVCSSSYCAIWIVQRVQGEAEVQSGYGGAEGR